MRAKETQDVPRLQKFEEKQAIARQVREDSKQLMTQLQDVRGKTLQTKTMQVEVRKQQRRQQQLRRELDQTRKEQARQDVNLSRYAELQEEIQNTELAIAAAEQEEVSAVQRLQNSQCVRAEVLSQLQVSNGCIPDSESADEISDGASPVSVPTQSLVSTPSSAPLRSARGPQNRSAYASTSPPASRSRASGKLASSNQNLNYASMGHLGAYP